jgi:hypothetical protein
VIIRKGDSDGNYFVAIYNETCDCYEFEADIILSQIKSYDVNLSFAFNFIGEDCDRFFLETSVPWINFPNQIEFEVVP